MVFYEANLDLLANNNCKYKENHKLSVLRLCIEFFDDQYYSEIPISQQQQQQQCFIYPNN